MRKVIAKDGTNFLVSEDVEGLDSLAEEPGEVLCSKNLDDLAYITFEDLSEPLIGQLVHVKSTRLYLALRLDGVKAKEFFGLVLSKRFKKNVKLLVIAGINGEGKYLLYSMSGSPEHCFVTLRKVTI